MKTPLQSFTEDTFRLASVKELRVAGYSRYTAGATRPHAMHLWQRRLRPGLYCNIYTYDIPEHPRGDILFQPEAQLRNDAKTVNLTMIPGSESLEAIEQFFLDAADWFESKYGPLEN